MHASMETRIVGIVPFEDEETHGHKIYVECVCAKIVFHPPQAGHSADRGKNKKPKKNEINNRLCVIYLTANLRGV